jgi:hypothetical protein
VFNPNAFDRRTLTTRYTLKVVLVAYLLGTVLCFAVFALLCYRYITTKVVPPPKKPIMETSSSSTKLSTADAESSLPLPKPATGMETPEELDVIPIPQLLGREGGRQRIVVVGLGMVAIAFM